MSSGVAASPRLFHSRSSIPHQCDEFLRCRDSLAFRIVGEHTLGERALVMVELDDLLLQRALAQRKA